VKVDLTGRSNILGPGAYGWGSDSYGVLGNGPTLTRNQLMPSPIAGGPGLTSWGGLSSGQYAACGVGSNGTGWCWGYDQWGNLGNGSLGASESPTPVDSSGGRPARWLTIKSGGEFACGLATNGAAWCWGHGMNGRIGNGANSDQPSPAAVNTAGGRPTAYFDIDVSSIHTCALAGAPGSSSGAAWCWGNGVNGEAGNGSKTGNPSSPVAIITSGRPTAYKDIEVGNAFSCGIDTGGAGWCWGTDRWGALGNGAGEQQTTAPGRIDTNSGRPATWRMLSGGWQHTCGIASNGTAWCWGMAESNRLGTGVNYSSGAVVWVPTPVATGGGRPSQWTSISAGGEQSCGIAADGSGWCWGNGGSGELGTGDTRSSNAPVEITGGLRWVVLQASILHYTLGIAQ
jgi:alpha-tubulin suppressor-like RCC1 family protein